MNNNETVTIKLNRMRFVLSVENNIESDNYKKANVSVGDLLDKGSIALMLMNPHRFNVIWEKD